MKKIKEIAGDQFYIFTGRSNANSCFIEKLSHGHTFLRYANYYLKDYIKVYDYIITRDGWAMALKINSKESILQISNKEDWPIWKIISEQVRKFLGTFVQLTNREKGRSGCLVHSSYEKYYFHSMEEAIAVINDMRQQRSRLYNGRKRYRGLKFHYRISKSVGKGSIFICSRDIRRKNLVLGSMKMFEITGLRKSVVAKMIKSTINSHSNQKSSHSTKTNTKFNPNTS